MWLHIPIAVRLSQVTGPVRESAAARAAAATRITACVPWAVTLLQLMLRIRRTVRRVLCLGATIIAAIARAIVRQFAAVPQGALGKYATLAGIC